MDLKKEKILIVSEVFCPEEFKVNDLALEWNSKGFEVHVLTNCPTYPFAKVFDGYKNRLYSVEVCGGVRIHRFATIVGYNKSVTRKIARYLLYLLFGSFYCLLFGWRYKYVFGYNVGPLTAMFPAYIAKKIYGKKLVLWAQDLWPDTVYAYGFKKSRVLGWLLDVYCRLIYSSADSIAVSSEGFKQNLRKFVSNDMRVFFAPNWPDESGDAGADSKFNDSCVNFTFAGNVGKVQNLDLICRAFSAASLAATKKATLNIVGDGSHLSDLKKIVKEECLQNISFWGRVPKTQVFGFLKESDYLIVSLVGKKVFSLTVPAKLQTYISAKKPIISVAPGETSSIVQRFSLGFTACPDSCDRVKELFSACIEKENSELIQYTRSCESLLLNTYNKEKIMGEISYALFSDSITSRKPDKIK